jgi:hypothetical protein
VSARPDCVRPACLLAAVRCSACGRRAEALASTALRHLCVAGRNTCCLRVHACLLLCVFVSPTAATVILLPPSLCFQAWLSPSRWQETALDMRCRLETPCLTLPPW